MSFIDEAVIEVQAGSGGHGCLSFRREKNIPMGGPDGGDGGKGGDVWFQATDQLNTLYPFSFQKKFQARNGECGQGRQKAGRQGADCVIEVPVGTLIHVEDTQFLLADLAAPGERCLVAKGGYGGLGNVRFKSSTRRAPRITTQGKEGELLTLRLTLSLLSDVGLMGVPNAGKSSLIRKLSAATPKVADYPFTTTKPHLGVVSLAHRKQLVMADIPGLIQGAAQGSGMGVRFLKHLQRCRCLLHVLDGARTTAVILEEKKMIDEELRAYDPSLLQKQRLYVLNKVDLHDEAELKVVLNDLNKGVDDVVLPISAITGAGLNDLKLALMNVCFPDNE